MKKEVVSGLLLFALLQQVSSAQNAPLQPGQLPPSAPAKPGQLAPTHDIGWPRQVSKNGAVLVYYQPQIDAWKDYKELIGRMAFSLMPSGGKAVLGVTDLKAKTLVDKDTHTVFFKAVDVTDVRFPSLQDEDSKKMDELFRSLLPTNPEPISVERIMADLEQSKVDAKPVAVKNDPPQIFYSATPAILLSVQGEPVFAPIASTDLQFLVNTNWDVFEDKSTKRYYLLTERMWLEAPELKGPWGPSLKLPPDMAKLPAGQNFDAVKKMVPPPPPPAPFRKSSSVPCLPS